MMPEFARGWERDGWEPHPKSPKRAVVKKHTHAVCDTAFSVFSGGLLMIDQMNWDRGDCQSITFFYGDPQTAKERAEALMEGL